jgi:hypothetical protein
MNDLTNMHDPLHTPSPEFRAALERDVMAAFRRESLFAVERPRHTVRWRAAATLLIGLCLGVGTSLASGQVQDARSRQEIAATIEASRQVAVMRLELARNQLDRARRLFETGVITKEALVAAENDLRVTEISVARIELELRESRESAVPPRDELWAPLVGGRDYVQERLLLQAAAVEQKLKAAEVDRLAKEKGVRIGAMNKSVLAEADAELLKAKLEMSAIEEKLELRKQFK